MHSKMIPPSQALIELTPMRMTHLAARGADDRLTFIPSATPMLSNHPLRESNALSGELVGPIMISFIAVIGK